ncbi:MAG TPA: DUF6596 domain-containing protein, partial [Fimbriimonas sp.]|nr:DUF6596 domain-containing protein [Fimbriimonas sp.]
SVGEIAKALMSSDSAVAQRLVRAKETLRSSGARFEMPEGADLRSRLQTILKALYLLFNEGYVAHSGDALTKDDLCDEAIILTSRLVETTPGNTPATHALLALMLLHSARMPSRIDESGALQLLEEQDRTKWDRSRISSGLFHLAQASTGDRLTPYHCEAAIAAAHCMSPSFDETDWVLVLSHYDDLMRVSPSPLARLNRAVAVWQVRGVEDALEELETLSPALDSYYLLHATRGRISGQPEHYAKALALTRNEAERRFIAKHQAGT